MISTLESSEEIQQGLGTAPTITPGDSHTVHSEQAPVDAPLEHELSATSNTLPQDTPEDTPEDPSISQTVTGAESTGPGTSATSNQSNSDEDEDVDSDSPDEDTDDDFPRFDDTPRGRIVKPVSGQKPTKPPK